MSSQRESRGCHSWLLDAIDQAETVDKLRVIQRIIKHEVAEEIEYTKDAQIMQQLVWYWKSKMIQLEKVSK